MEKILKVVDRIRSESLEKLQDPSFLEFKLLPELGLNDRHLDQYPSHLHPYCGIGIDSWQYPNQFSKYLHHLSQLGISSYAEIGCHKGGTFIITVEYLARFNDLVSCLAVDNWRRETMDSYAQLRENVVYLSASSDSEEFAQEFAKRSWDLTLIDGDHSYKAVRRDFNAIRPGSKLVAFHDVRNALCPGTQQIWDEVKGEYRPDQLHEWSDQYDEVLLRMRGSVMGIGLLDQR